MKTRFDSGSSTPPCGTLLPKWIDARPREVETRVNCPNGVSITAYCMKDRVTYWKNENKTAIPTTAVMVPTNASNSVTKTNVGRLSE